MLYAFAFALGLIPGLALAGFRLGIAMSDWINDLSEDVHVHHS